MRVESAWPVLGSLAPYDQSRPLQHLAAVGHEYMVSKHRGGRAPPTRFRLAGGKGQQMRFISHRRGRTAVPASIAIRQATRFLDRGRSGALVLGLAAAAAVAVPASASASNGPSPVVGHVYVNDNTKPDQHDRGV